MTSIVSTGSLPPPQLNPPPQTTITPAPISNESDSLSQDFPIEFIRLAIAMNGPGFHIRKLQCSFSIFRNFYEILGELLYDLDREEYFQYINSKLNLEVKNVEELIGEFYIRLSVFNETENRAPFINFVVTISELIVRSSDNEKLEMNRGFFKRHLKSKFIYVFLNSPKKLLNEPMINFIFPSYVYSEKDRFRIAVLKNCYLNFDMDTFIRCQWALNHKVQEDMTIFNTFSPLQNSLYILQNNKLSCCQKRILFHIYNKIRKTLKSDLDDFITCIILNLRVNSLGCFYPIVKAKEAKIIAGIENPDNRDIDTLPYNPNFVKNNRVIYENFILKIREIVDYLEEHAGNGERYWSFFKNFFLYIYLADISSVLNEETLKKPYDELEKIILEDLEKFSHKLKEDKTLLIASASLLQDPKFVDCKNFLRSANCIAVYFRKIYQLTNGLIKPFLLGAEQSQNDLDILFSPHSLRPVNIHSKPKNKEKEKETESHHSEATEIYDKPVIKPGEEAEVQEASMLLATPSARLPLSPVEQLQQGRETIEETCSKLAKNCHAYGSKEAICDAQGHLDELCCTIQRFLRQKEKSITAQHVLFLVIDSIRHGTLALEQILCALSRESNGIKNQKQLRNHTLTHNLYILLASCKLTGLFPQKISNWIRKNNHGEVIIRGNYTLKSKNSIADDLFTKARSLSNGHSSIEPEKLIQELFGYLIDLIRVCEQLKKQLQISIKIPFDGAKSFECLLPCLRTLGKEPCQLACHQERSLENVREFKEKLDIFKTNPAADLKNLMENLIPHLEYELENQNTLHPFEARLHLGNILLLNQMIAENILLNCIKDEVELEKGKHDLMFLIKSLKIVPEMVFTSKELAFLKRGSETRLLVRYPANYLFSFKNKRKAIEEKLSQTYFMAKKISKEEKLTQQYHLEEGFQLVHSKLVNQLNEIKQLAQDDVQVMMSIISKVLEMAPETIHQ